jgi:formylglycine-generating enzyme
VSLDLEMLFNTFGADGDADQFFQLGQSLEGAEDVHHAASAYDRAYGLAPQDKQIAAARARLLDSLSIEEHGITFRYIPAGTFLMGSDSGDPDEHPAHPVRLPVYWLSETPISWATFCRLMGWMPPPQGFPHDIRETLEHIRNESVGTDYWHHPYARLGEATRIQRQYCHDEVRPAGAHHFASQVDSYEFKPMVAVSWDFAQQLGTHLSDNTTLYRLPSEAEWEKGARGGLIGSRYFWGDTPPSWDNCDFNRLPETSILPMRIYPPNGYGLYAMNGGVWEWTLDWYDAEYFADSPLKTPPGPLEGEYKVARGGSWTDCAEAVTVSFRMAARPDWPPANLGFRLARVANN